MKKLINFFREKARQWMEDFYGFDYDMEDDFSFNTMTFDEFKTNNEFENMVEYPECLGTTRYITDKQIVINQCSIDGDEYQFWQIIDGEVNNIECFTITNINQKDRILSFIEHGEHVIPLT